MPHLPPTLVCLPPRTDMYDMSTRMDTLLEKCVQVGLTPTELGELSTLVWEESAPSPTVRPVCDVVRALARLHYRYLHGDIV